jgi:hypothetical protein
MLNVLMNWGFFSGTGAIEDWLDDYENVLNINIGYWFTTENRIFDILGETDRGKKLILLNKLRKLVFLDGYNFLPGYIHGLYKNTIHRNYYDKWEYWSFYSSFFHFINIELRELSNDRPFDEYKHWQKWLHKLSYIGSKKKKADIFVHHNSFNCPMIFSGHENIWPHFYDPFKLIFVHRDPLDQFADLVNEENHLNNFWGKNTRSIGSDDVIFLDAADRFFVTSKKFYLARLEYAKKYTLDTMLIVSFEDFILKHDLVTKKIALFLDFDIKTPKIHNGFLAEDSKKNIGIGQNNEKVMDLLKHKSYIVEELNDLRDQLYALPHSIR